MDRRSSGWRCRAARSTANQPGRAATNRAGRRLVLLRTGLEAILERFGHLVVASVGDAEALVGAVDEQHPDLVITDVRMPPHFTDEGLRAAVELRSRHPRLAVIVLSQFVQQTYAAELLSRARPESATC